MLEQINENASIEVDSECEVDVEDDSEDEGEGDDTTIDGCDHEDLNKPGKILVCHKGKKTISISPSAWPAHEAHGDSCGPCGGGS